MTRSSFHSSMKPLKEVDLSQPESIVRGAVVVDPRINIFLPKERSSDTYQKSAYESFDKAKENVHALITRLARQLVLRHAPESGEINATDYGLKFESGHFLCDENKDILPMENFARILVERLPSGEVEALQFSLALSMDPVFVKAFNSHELQGIQKVISIIESGEYERNSRLLNPLLQNLLSLMGHSELFNLHTGINTTLIKRIASYVTGSAKFEDNDTVFFTLCILDRILSSGELTLEKAVKEEIKFETLIHHLTKRDERILPCVLRLMGKLYGKSTADERSVFIEKVLHSRAFTADLNSALAARSHIDQELKEQLLLLQGIILDELKHAVANVPLGEEVEFVAKMEMWDPATETPTSPRDSLSGSAGSTHQLESGCVGNSIFQPGENGEETHGDMEKFKSLMRQSPPGSLALFAILHHVKSRKSQTNQAIQHTEEVCIRSSAWPLIMARLTLSLVHILGIAGNTGQENPNPSDRQFLQFLLTSEEPFDELFSISLSLFKTTWAEMRASMNDLESVLTVVHQQIMLGIGRRPPTMDFLRNELKNSFSYAQMGAIWEMERVEREELEFSSKPIRALCDHIRPTIEKLVLQRRKNWLKRGCLFTRPAPAANDSVPKRSTSTADSSEQWLWRLENNEHFFSLAKVLDKESVIDSSTTTGTIMNPTSTSLGAPNKHTIDRCHPSTMRVPVSRIVSVLHGSNRLTASSTTPRFSTLSLNRLASDKMLVERYIGKTGLVLSSDDGQQQEVLHLCTSDETELAKWVEALNCLLYPQTVLQSPEISNEVESLLRLELRVRLLGIPPGSWNEEIPLPSAPDDLSWLPVH